MRDIELYKVYPNFHTLSTFTTDIHVKLTKAEQAMQEHMSP